MGLGLVCAVGVAGALAAVAPMAAMLATAATPLLPTALMSAAVVLPIAGVALAILSPAALALAVSRLAHIGSPATVRGIEIGAAIAVIIAALRVPARTEPAAIGAFALMAAMLRPELLLRRHDDAIVVLGVLEVALGADHVA
jgi:hypothetical protein